ncbi:hypothetical protein ATANTOWER_029217 [Ataeniobius toweri]|uniref:Uncharacterized protein n=1 Tax=Ataeniobius toweri TaxID=208326 RepID=A0ABU7C495_9TELE|nr:hypothetical protein [Ataeniobius toweri]
MLNICSPWIVIIHQQGDCRPCTKLQRGRVSKDTDTRLATDVEVISIGLENASLLIRRGKIGHIQKVCSSKSSAPEGKDKGRAMQRKSKHMKAQGANYVSQGVEEMHDTDTRR